MSQPEVSRPHFPPGYVENPQSFLSWEQVKSRLESAKNYWLSSVRPDGRPHSVPKWGVWVDNRFYFDGSPATRHARNIARNPHVNVHLESGDHAVIVEGSAAAISQPDPTLAEQIARAYTIKYAALGYSPAPDQWDQGGLFVVIPQSVLAWTQFTDNPTKFEFK